MSRGRIVLAAAVPCAVALIACGGGSRHAATAARTGPLHCKPEVRRFRTLPTFRPTGFCVAARPGATSDLLLVTPRPAASAGKQYGPMIISSDGKLLWYQPRPDKVHDLKVVQVDGGPALAFWQRGHGGSYVLLDDHYRQIGRVREGRGRGTDL